MRSQNANRMLTLFRKICFDGKNPQSLVLTVKTPETPVKSRVSGVLKGAEKRSKCSKRHPFPRTRNQFAGNRTWVRIPPSPPRRSKVRFAPTSFYTCGKKDVIRPLPCSSFPTATRCAGLAVGEPSCGRHFSPLRNIDFNRPFHVVAKSGFAATLFYARGRQPPPVSLFSSATRIPERSAARHPCGRHLPTSKYRNIDSNNPPNLKREDISKVPSLFFSGPCAQPHAPSLY